MLIRSIIFAALLAASTGYVQVQTAAAVPAFARQYDVQCNACHTRPPRLNRFGEQFHMMGFQMPSAARPGGIVGSVKEDGPVKTLIDSLALRIVGGLFEYSESPRVAEAKFEPPHEVEPPHDGPTEPPDAEPPHEEPGHEEPGEEPGHDEPGHDEPGHD